MRAAEAEHQICFEIGSSDGLGAGGGGAMGERGVAGRGLGRGGRGAACGVEVCLRCAGGGGAGGGWRGHCCFCHRDNRG